MQVTVKSTTDVSFPDSVMPARVAEIFGSGQLPNLVDCSVVAVPRELNPSSSGSKLVALSDTHHFAPISLRLKLEYAALIQATIEHDPALVRSAPRHCREKTCFAEIDEQSLARARKITSLQLRAAFTQVRHYD
jgi:hypothetical protein